MSKDRGGAFGSACAAGWKLGLLCYLLRLVCFAILNNSSMLRLAKGFSSTDAATLGLFFASFNLTGQQLDCDGTPELSVEGPEDNAHAPLAEFCFKAIGAD